MNKRTMRVIIPLAAGAVLFLLWKQAQAARQQQQVLLRQNYPYLPGNTGLYL